MSRDFFAGRDFPWPAPPHSAASPRWNGDSFVLGSDAVRILAYGSAASAWSERLSDMNEIEAGPKHPIGQASRRMAVESMQRLSGRRPLRILDVGCSSGFIIDELATALPQADLFGTDYIMGPLEKLAQRSPGLPLLQFDMCQCPLPADCIDGVTCLNVLEHIEDDRNALRQIYRILKPGGIAHIEVPANPALHDIYDEHLMHYRRYRLAELVQLARDLGFSIAKATHSGFMVYPGFWVVKKRNRRKLSAPADEKARLVLRQIRATRTSLLFSLVTRLETSLGRAISYPFGIRCVVVLRKPQSG